MDFINETHEILLFKKPSQKSGSTPPGYHGFQKSKITVHLTSDN